MKPRFAIWQQALLVLLLSFLVYLPSARGQIKVGQPSGAPDPSAALDVSGGPYSSGSQYRGIAPPKVALTSSAQAAPVTKPVTGLLIYNTSTSGDVTPGYYYWEGGKWLRFTTASAGAARVAVNGQSIPAYLISQVVSLSSPDIIYIADPGKEGMFSYVSGSGATVDNALVLGAGSGGQYKRILPDRRITPQMFGAIANDTINDGPALLAWINTTGSYIHELPAGDYISTVQLDRLQKGFFTLEGKGRILFKGTGSGIYINNSSSDGVVTIEGITIESMGTKSNNAIGLMLWGQHLKEGHRIRNVTVRGQTNADWQWANGIELHNCSNTVITGCNVYAMNHDKTKGLVLSNGEGQPSVQHNISDLTVAQGEYAVYFNNQSSTGSQGIEGIHFTNLTVVGSRHGVWDVSYHGSPGLNFVACHINVNGGEAIHLDNVQQVYGFGNYFYVYPEDKTVNSAMPARGVYIHDTEFMNLTFTLFLLANSPIGVELKGKGGASKLTAMGAWASPNTTFVVKDCSFGAVVDYYSSTRDGTNTWGTGIGQRYAQLGDCPGFSTMVVSAEEPNNGDVYRYDNGVSRPVKPHRAFDRSALVVTGAGSYTVNPQLYDVVSVNNYNGPATILIDDAKFDTKGQSITIKYDNSDVTQPITVQNLSGKSLQNANMNFLASVVIPMKGQKSMTWEWETNDLRLMDGVDLSAYSTTTETNAQIKAAIKKNVYSVTYSGSSDATIAVPLTGIQYISVYHTGTGNLYVALDLASAEAGGEYIVKLSPGSSGPTFITTSPNNINRLEKTDGTISNVTTLSTADGKRQMHFRWNTVNFEFMGY